MMDARAFAQTWIAAWNSHDLDEILSHYADDIEISSPMIRMAADIDGSSLEGKPAVAAYWRKALDRVPDLHFELIDVTTGVDSVALYYKSIMGKMAIEVMFFDVDGRISRMYAHYS